MGVRTGAQRCGTWAYERGHSNTQYMGVRTGYGDTRYRGVGRRQRQRHNRAGPWEFIEGARAARWWRDTWKLRPMQRFHDITTRVSNTGNKLSCLSLPLRLPRERECPGLRRVAAARPRDPQPPSLQVHCCECTTKVNRVHRPSPNFRVSTRSPASWYSNVPSPRPRTCPGYPAPGC